jgi:phosphoribosylformylglycinamidine cyclo-ligase
VFDWLQRGGNVADDEMHRVFNCGIGLVLAVAAKDVDETIRLLGAAGARAYAIGELVARPAGAEPTVIV